MAANVRYEVTLTDDVVEVEGADAYAPDGRMTTFYRCRDDRQALDSWAKRVASSIGRASCRGRVCQYVYISVVAVSLKKHNIPNQTHNTISTKSHLTALQEK